MKKKSKKPIYKDIKAWCDLYDDGGAIAIDCNHGVRSIPCVIRIKTKYLKGEK